MHLLFTEAQKSDLTCLVQLLADDALGKHREDASEPIDGSYLHALDQIISDPNNELIVVKADKKVIGMLQLTFIPYLTHKGSWRCLIEGVRIHSDHRGQGLGSDFFKWAIDRAQTRNCKIVQLTSDKERPDAIRFYEKLGFKASHEGLKLTLTT